MQKPNSFIQRIRRQPRWKIAAALGVLVLAGWFYFSRAKSVVEGITFEARRGNLQINVLEGGSIEALESQEIRSEVKGGQGTKILKIVEEGYQVTDEDVKAGKVLVELDSSDLKTRMTQQEISFQTTLASFTEATQGYDIQLNQNKTDVKAAEQKAKFARLDLEKFMSDVATREIITQLNLHEIEGSTNETGLDVILTSQTAPINATDPRGRSNSEDDFKPVSADPVVSVDTNQPPQLDYTKYATLDLLGDGAAKQQLRKLLDDLQVAEQQQGLGKAKLQGTERLFEKGFVTKTELETEQMIFKNNELKVQTAITARDLFI